MSYFLSGEKLILGREIVLKGPEALHILLSRRVKLGEILQLQDQGQKRFACEVVSIVKKELVVKVVKPLEIPLELSAAITLYQSMVSEKALDFILQKTTELGILNIFLFNSERTATKMTLEQFAKKYERWEKILWESAKQCDRSVIPKLSFLPDLQKVLDQTSEQSTVYILDASGVRLESGKKDLKVSLAVGPEGGFTQNELEQLKTIPNSKTVSISPFTLRAETAAIASLVIVQTMI